MKKQLFLLVMMLLPLVASADDSGTCGDNLTWTFVESTGTLTISGSGAMYNFDLAAPWSSYGAKISAVVIENSVTSIGSYAFFACSSLTSVTIPDSVTSIGNHAFSRCLGLTSVTIGNSVESIGSYAFDQCSSLTIVTIPDSVTSIGSYAFSGCLGLTSVTIGNSVESIGSYAFYTCNSLTSVTIPDNVASIGYYAFEGCSKLTSVTITVTDLAAFCNNQIVYLSYRTIGKHINLIDVEGKEIKEYIIPNSVTSIGDNAFWCCSGLTSVTIPSSVTSIGNSAFANCSGLTSITIPNSVTSIGDNAFYNCSGMTSVIIPNSVTSIGDKTFSGCSGLTSVTIGNSVKSIGSYAFSVCHGLTSITIGKSVTNIGSHAFTGCHGLTSITIPNNVTSIGEGAFAYCYGLNSISVERGNTKYDSREGCNAIIETGTNTLISGCLISVIPPSVTNIGSFAFSGCSGLTSITIPNSVTSIGNSAFANCSGLTSITIPNSVTSIGNSAFANCSGLTSITIPNSVTNIGSYAFSGCSGLTSITIPDNVISIGYLAFQECSSLTSLTIGKSVSLNNTIICSECPNLTNLIFHCKEIGSWFSKENPIKNVTIGEEVTCIEKGVFNSYRIENVLTQNSKTTGNNAFSDRTYQHAMLYIPEGTWSEAIYDGDWYMFNNIRETTMNTGDFSPSRTYTLMDTKTFGYAVYDEVSGEVKMVKAFYNIDEQDLNNCWQVITQADKKYLYNLGAKKYATISTDGRIRLTSNKIAIEVKEDDGGIILGADTSNLWGFVKNNAIASIETSIVTPAAVRNNDGVYYDLKGQRVNNPRKGLNIVVMQDGTVKKNVVK